MVRTARSSVRIPNPPVRELPGSSLFTADAITVIHNAGRGYPRAINNLGVHALTAAYAAGNPVVDEKAARAALTETATD